MSSFKTIGGLVMFLKQTIWRDGTRTSYSHDSNKKGTFLGALTFEERIYFHIFFKRLKICMNFCSNFLMFLLSFYLFEIFNNYTGAGVEYSAILIQLITFLIKISN